MSPSRPSPGLSGPFTEAFLGVTSRVVRNRTASPSPWSPQSLVSRSGRVRLAGPDGRLKRRTGVSTGPAAEEGGTAFAPCPGG